MRKSISTSEATARTPKTDLLDRLTKHNRNIRTDYYRGNVIVKSTFAKWANNAVGNSVKHMRKQSYDSTHCETYDTVTGKLHCVIRYYRRRSTIEIIFKHKAQDSEWREV